MGLLDNKVCLITGGAGSIGLETAKLFLHEGAKVALVDLNPIDPASLAFNRNPESILTLTADVTRSEDTQRYIQDTVEQFGNIDVLFSNAGIFGTAAPIAQYPEEVFDQVQAVHVRGAFLACKYTEPVMNDGGSIIINSSVSGVSGAPGVHAYTTAKHAQIGLMRCLARELAGRNIRVNTLHPGPVDNSFQKAVEDKFSEMAGIDATEMLNQQIPLGRHGSGEEIARSALYLASGLSSFTTGTTLVVDGGMSS